MSVTLKDVATELGLSMTTVSLALRDHPRAQRFSSNTRRRIASTANRLGYQPNFFAAQLARPKSTLLMACVSYLVDPWAMAVLEGFEARATQRQHRVLIATLKQQEEAVAFHQDILGPKGAAGMAVIGARTNVLSDQMIRELADGGVRIVLVSRELDHPNVGQVQCDNYGGARAAAEHICQQGLRNVWILSADPSVSKPSRDRLRGYLDVARDNGVPTPSVLWIDPRDMLKEGYRAVINHLRGHEAPEAVLSAADPAAVGAVRALTEKGLVVGRDVAVVGFDGGIYSESCYPPLSSVHQPMGEMGRAGADLLIDLLEHPEKEPQKIMLPTELVVRDSSRMKGG
jgi:LacI family transcriptional regulator